MGEAPTRALASALVLLALLLPARSMAQGAMKPRALSWTPDGKQVTWIEADPSRPGVSFLVSVDRQGIKRWLLSYGEDGDAPIPDAPPPQAEAPTPAPQAAPMQAAPQPSQAPREPSSGGLYDLPGAGEPDLSRGLVDLERPPPAPAPTPAPPQVVAPVPPPAPARAAAAGPPHAALPFDGYQFTPRGDALLVEHDGDLYTLRLSDGAATRLTFSPDVDEADPVIDPLGHTLAFGAMGHVWTVPLDGATPPRRLTPDAPAGVTQGELDWVYAEELTDAGERPIAFSPDGRLIAYLVLDDREVPVYPLVHAAPAPAEIELQPFPIPGGAIPKASVHVVDREGNPVAWWDLDGEGYIPPLLTFTVDGEGLAFMTLDRAQETQRLLLLDLKTNEVDLLHELTMPFWHDLVGGPVFLPDGKHYVFSTPLYGFVQPFIGNLDRPRKKLKRLVNVPWNMRLLGADPAGEWLYFTGSGDLSTEQHLFKVKAEGGGLTRITLRWGWHDVSLSPQADAFVDTFSSVEALPETTLWQGRDKIATLHSAKDEGVTLPGTREIVTLRAEGDVKLYGELWRPLDFDPKRRYPVVVEVYGGPTVQTVTEEAKPERLVAKLLADGYLVWRLDNRGSGGRMHRFQAAIDGELGKVELEDQLIGVDYLRKQAFVDPSRVAIVGASYGGYMALYAMTHSTAFKAGVAIAPVTDWRRYDAVYTERYMGTPAQNPGGYDRASVVQAAAQLTGPVLLIHGSADDNCHLDNSLAFYSAALEAGRDAELAVLPDASHRYRTIRPAAMSLMVVKTEAFLASQLKGE